ncbi:MAG: DUF4446 family protein [Bacilli bacterium]
MFSSLTSNISNGELVIGILTSLILVILSLVAATAASFRTARLKKRYKGLVRGETGQNLEQLITDNHEQVAQLERELERLRRVVETHERRLQASMTTARVVRYNAFGENGNDLSFSLALLNEQGDGAVLSSIFGREESRVYAKPVAEGNSTYTLTDEERKVIEAAANNPQSEH